MAMKAREHIAEAERLLDLVAAPGVRDRSEDLSLAQTHALLASAKAALPDWNIEYHYESAVPLMTREEG